MPSMTVWLRSWLGIEASYWERWWLLFSTLVQKDIRIRYKQTFLGIAWALFQPIVMMLVFTFIFTRIASIDTHGIPYPLFAYIGIIPWNFFAQGLTGSVTSLTQYAPIFTRVYVPKAVFPLAALASKWVDMLISLAVLLVLFIYYHFIPAMSAPMILLYFINQLLLMIGIGLLVSMGNLFYRDVGYIFTVMVQLWMFVSPVLYPVYGQGSRYDIWLRLNPMYTILNAYRSLVFGMPAPSTLEWLVNTLVCVAICWLGIRCFNRYEYLLAERC